jgi:hypothetical protein
VLCAELDGFFPLTTLECPAGFAVAAGRAVLVTFVGAGVPAFAATSDPVKRKETAIIDAISFFMLSTLLVCKSFIAAIGRAEGTPLWRDERHA